MVFKRNYPKPDISEEELKELRRIRSSTKEEKRRVLRASIILDYLDGYSTMGSRPGMESTRTRLRNACPSCGNLALRPH